MKKNIYGCMKVLIKDLSDRRAEADGVILIFLVDADLDVDCGACTGLQSAADKPARLTIVPDTTCQIRYKITNSGACTCMHSAAAIRSHHTTKHFVTANLQIQIGMTKK